MVNTGCIYGHRKQIFILIFKLYILRKNILYFVLFLIQIGVYAQTVNPTPPVHPNDPGGTLRIPVVFHVVHETPHDIGISENLLIRFLSTTNSLMNNVDTSQIENLYRSRVGSPNIELYLLESISSCDAGYSGISWDVTSRSDFGREDTFFEKNLSFIDGDLDILNNFRGNVAYSSALHVWICNSLFTVEEDGKSVTHFQSFATYPETTGFPIDGIVFSLGHFSQKNVQVFIHELGHYLDLSHIWEKRGVNIQDSTDCSDDDGFTDTPQQAGANLPSEIALGNIQKDCLYPTIDGNYENFMDYSFEEVGMFTEEQAAHMRYTIFEHRPGLLATQMCGSVPSNDECLNAQALNSFSTDVQEAFLVKTGGTVSQATLEDLPTECDSNQATGFKGRGVWYTFTAQHSSSSVFVSHVNSFNPAVSIYSGSCDALVYEGCNRNTGSGSELTVFNLDNFVVGDQYWVRIYNGGTTGSTLTESEFKIWVRHSSNPIEDPDTSTEEPEDPIVDKPTDILDFAITDYLVKDGDGGGEGNENGHINLGEEIDLDIELQNLSQAIVADNVVGILTTTTPGVIITDDSETWSDFGGGEKEWESDFDFEFEFDFDSDAIDFVLTIQTKDDQEFRKTFSIPVQYPNDILDFAITDYLVKDGDGGGEGNEDGLIQIREEIDLEVQLENLSQGIWVDNLTGVLTTSTPGVIITDDDIEWNHFSGGEKLWESDFDFEFEFDFDSDAIDFVLTIQTKDDQEFRKTFSIPVQYPNDILDFAITDYLVKDGDGGGEGNEDGLIQIREEIDLEVQLENLSQGIWVDNLTGVLTTSTPGVIITDDDIEWNHFSGGEKLWESDFDFEFDSDFNSDAIDFTLTLYTEYGQELRKTFNIPVYPAFTNGVALEVCDYRVKDGRRGGKGNRNAQIDPGEEIDLDVCLRNNDTSRRKARDVKGRISLIGELQDYVRITDSYESWGDIYRGREDWESDFDFTVADDYPLTLIGFFIDISTQSGSCADIIIIPVNGNRSSKTSAAKRSKDLPRDSVVDTMSVETITVPSSDGVSEDLPIIYPNPVDSSSVLHIAKVIGDELDVTVINLEGTAIKRVFSGTVADTDLIHLNLEDSLPSGVYVVRIVRNGFPMAVRILKD